MKKAFVVDFDGTIMEQDVGFSIIKKFAGQGWKEIGDLWVKREITTEECGRKQWNLIKEDPKNIIEYVKKFQLNKGFKEFYNFIIKNDCKLIVASDGYDFYIKELFKYNDIKKIEISCNHLHYDNGWNLSFLNKDKECNICGNCKKKIVESLKKDGYKVYYIGDGYSDTCAAQYSDVIFAKSFLKDYCDKEKICYFKFDDFFDILEKLLN